MGGAEAVVQSLHTSQMQPRSEGSSLWWGHCPTLRVNDPVKSLILIFYTGLKPQAGLIYRILKVKQLTYDKYKPGFLHAKPE